MQIRCQIGASTKMYKCSVGQYTFEYIITKIPMRCSNAGGSISKRKQKIGFSPC